MRFPNRLSRESGLLRRSSQLSVLFFALVAPAALALNPAEKPANYTVTRWDAEDGLPHNSVRQILQTHDGYLWMGTNQGLARFDGLAFTIFSSPETPGLPGNQITSLAETADGSLWIATISGLAQYRAGHFTAYGRAQGLKTDIINALCVAPDGSLWIGGREGITRWVGGKFVNDIDTSAYNMIGMRHIGLDSHNVLWVAFGSEVVRYADGKFTRFGREQGLPARPLQMIREDADGRLLAVTQDGLFRLEDGRFVPFEQNAALSSPRLTTALLDHAGNLWLASAGGLDRYSGGQLVRYANTYGVGLTVVDALFEDREGCLWVGSAGGLARFTDRRGYTLGKADGILGSFGMAVLQSRDGSIWASSWTGGVARFQNGTVRQYAVGAPLSHENITAIYEAPDGIMWFGTRGSAVDRLEGDKVTTFVYPPGVATSRPVSAIHLEPDGELLVGIVQRGLLQKLDDRLVQVPEAAGMAAETVRAIHRTRDGRLLIGTTKGIFQRAPNRTWQPVTPPDLKQSPEVREFLEEENGVLWLATESMGLVRWAPGHARAYGTREGMVDNTLYGLVDDGAGSLWVSSARGLARVRKTELADLDRGVIARLNGLTLGRVDGLQSGATPGSGTPSAALVADGRLLTATDRGIAVVDPHSLQTNSRPPTVVIESAIADDAALDLVPDRGLMVPAGTNRLELRYTALSLIAPQRLRFRYRLEGSDPGWIEAGREHSASYTHLAPGTYTFRVLACNNDGVWNEIGATLALTLLPLYYQTLWFRLTAFALLGGALAGAVGLRLRQLKQREQALTRANAELDQRVRERTGQLTHSNEELQHRETLFRLIFEHAPVGIFWNRLDLGTQYHFNSAFCRILELPAETLPDNSVLTALVHPEDAPRQSGQETLLRAGHADSYALEQRFVLKDGRQVWGAFAAAVVRDAQGQIIQVIGILEDITVRKQTERALRESNEKFHQLADNIRDVFWIRSPDMREVHYVSPAFERIWGRSVASLLADPKEWANFILPEDRARVLAAYAALSDTAASLDIEYRIVRPDGEIRWVRVRGSQVRETTTAVVRHIGIVTDITARKQTEAELAGAHRRLLDTSRQAGMAEVATSVLHNVGNVLNSVNVSATLVASQVRHTKSVNIAKLAELLNQHEADLANFLTADPRGQKLPAYLSTLGAALVEEHKAMTGELDNLRKNIDHIKEIVSMQQAYAGTAGLSEALPVSDLVEDALRIDASSFTRHDIVLVRDYQAPGNVTTDKHKVLQILINLVRNARHACNESGRPGKQITLHTTRDGRSVRIAVIDNGVGIPAENLARIFNHGFTTRKDGHGFGLHSGALAARELGGTLSVQSAGPGQGATFTLELPGQPAASP